MVAEARKWHDRPVQSPRGLLPRSILPLVSLASLLFLVLGTCGGVNAAGDLMMTDNGDILHFWETEGSLQTARYGFGFTDYNGKIYTFAGYNGDIVPNYGYLYSTEIYDPATGTWTYGNDIPVKKDGHVAVELGGLIYVIGGYEQQQDTGEGEYFDHNHVYNPSNGNWQGQKEGMLTERVALAGTSYGGKIYVFGGSRENGVYLRSAEVYNPSTDAWTRLPDMKYGRGTPGVTVFNNQIYLFGGIDSRPVNTVEVFDPDAGTNGEWRELPPMKYARQAPVAITVRDKILVFGGSQPPDVAAVEQFDPVTETWSVVTNMPTGRYWHGGSMIGDKIYMYGGYNNSIVGGEAVAYTDLLEVDNLIPMSPDISFSSEELIINNTVTLYANVSNFGNADLTGVEVRFYNREQYLGSDTINVAQGTTRQASLDWYVTGVDVAPTEIIVRLDETDGKVENDEYNNNYYRRVNIRGLELTATVDDIRDQDTRLIQAGLPYNCVIDIHNTGLLDMSTISATEKVKVSFYVNDTFIDGSTGAVTQTQTLIGIDEVSIGAGGSAPAEVSWDVPLDPGPRVITIKIDEGNEWWEEFEDNNTIVWNTAIRAPDIRVEEVLYDSPVLNGEELEVSVRLVNEGGMNAENYPLRIVTHDSYGSVVTVWEGTKNIIQGQPILVTFDWDVPERPGPVDMVVTLNTVMPPILEEDRSDNVHIEEILVQGSELKMNVAPYYGSAWAAAEPITVGRGDVAYEKVGTELFLIGGVKRTLEEFDIPYTNFVEAFNASRNEWEARSGLPVSLTAPAAAAHGTKIYVAGGFQEDWGDFEGYSDLLFKYDTQRNEWFDLSPSQTEPQGVTLNTARQGAAAVVRGDYLYVIGGRTSSEEPYTNEIEVFDVSQNPPVHLPSMFMPTPRGYLGAEVVGEHLVVVGGRNLQKAAMDTVDVYNFTSGKWTEGRPMPAPSRQVSTESFQGRLLTVGGFDKSTGYQNTVNAYDPVMDRWESFTTIPSGRAGQGVAIIEGRLFIAGGMDLKSYVSTTHSYLLYYSPDITFSSLSVDEDRSITIWTNITNEGVKMAEEVVVGYYDNAEPIGTVTIDVPAGTTVTAEYVWQIPNRLGARELQVRLDPGDGVKEYNELDNNYFVQILINGPDMTYSAAGEEAFYTRECDPTARCHDQVPSVGRPVELVLEMTNLGYVNISNVAVRFTLKEDPEGRLLNTVIGTDHISIPVNGSAEAVVIWTPGNKEELVGDHRIEVYIDPENAIIEESESNNHLVKEFRVSAPNLKVLPENVGISPAPTYGDTVQLTAIVSNTGSGDVLSASVKFFEADTGLQKDEVFVDVPEGGTAEATVDIIVPNEYPRNFEYRIELDKNDHVIELREDDNELVKSFAVEATEIKILSTEIILDDAISDGKTTVVSATVWNTGKKRAVAAGVELLKGELRSATTVARSNVTIEPNGYAVVNLTWLASLTETEMATGKMTLSVRVNGDQRIFENHNLFSDNTGTASTQADDGDGFIGDKDAFPTDPNCWKDSDGDGICDNNDLIPFGSDYLIMFLGSVSGIAVLGVIREVRRRAKDFDYTKFYDEEDEHTADSQFGFNAQALLFTQGAGAAGMPMAQQPMMQQPMMQQQMVQQQAMMGQAVPQAGMGQPAVQQPAAAAQQPAQSCPFCGKGLQFIQQYGKFYCYSCQKYP